MVWIVHAMARRMIVVVMMVVVAPVVPVIGPVHVPAMMPVSMPVMPPLVPAVSIVARMVIPVAMAVTVSASMLSAVGLTVKVLVTMLFVAVMILVPAAATVVIAAYPPVSAVRHGRSDKEKDKNGRADNPLELVCFHVGPPLSEVRRSGSRTTGDKKSLHGDHDTGGRIGGVWGLCIKIPYNIGTLGIIIRLERSFSLLAQRNRTERKGTVPPGPTGLALPAAGGKGGKTIAS